MYGVLFRIPVSDIGALDSAEGATGSHPGYKRDVIGVQTEGGTVDAATYFALKFNALLKPYTWYRSLVIAGAQQHGLPAEYVATLEAKEAVEDRDPERHASEMQAISV